MQGQAALVTGGASGIGQAIAAALARAGADVAVTINSQPADATRRHVEAAGRRLHEVRADLGRPEAAQRAVAETVAALGRLDIVVNNAGIIRRADAVEYAEEDWRAVLDLNLDAVWRLSQAAGSHMLAHGGGKIVNIASLLSFQGGIRVPAYAASKHAVLGLTRALANEWAARGVNVNAIAPGYIATANTAALRADETRNRQILERIPAGRWGEPDDLAGAAVFLSSRAADYVHGQVLAVDGGWMAR
ncbi:2-dehydro-3-deoxy-D-gluconate 5-dehydrogenase KduD [Chitinimonas koreensis]|uniref:2-dehydro-3-deoxy-D-gluconate 5-dehydrogenase KduD n=1 Tax=Chitinimonas koreensis TaxID=356302 RepID=UPI001654AE3E|nr:2-dehydro-3-deoxy-D-gluconate 5-dehydrogenase KduD [Chitinimonas koreensis]QNM98875.1 2-dehydro-3-deoxy-D-gluconate 5-dehydrogenase KduD [Chitinimonas koreensis]